MRMQMELAGGQARVLASKTAAVRQSEQSIGGNQSRRCSLATTRKKVASMKIDGL
jgi:hypothetical protein